MKVRISKACAIAASALVLSGAFAGAQATEAAHARRIVVAQVETPSGEGVVNSIDVAARKVNLTHGPVAALKWPGMTMDFPIAPGLDLSALKPGARIGFTLKKGGDGMYLIDSIKPAQ